MVIQNIINKMNKKVLPSTTSNVPLLINTNPKHGRIHFWGGWWITSLSFSKSVAHVSYWLSFLYLIIHTQPFKSHCNFQLLAVQQQLNRLSNIADQIMLQKIIPNFKSSFFSDYVASFVEIIYCLFKYMYVYK